MDAILSFFALALLIGVPCFSVVFEILMLPLEAVRDSGKPENIQWYASHGKIRKFYERYRKIGFIVESILILIAIGLEVAYLELVKTVDFSANWQTQLYNQQMHSPFNPEYSIGTIAVVAFYLISMIVLYLINANKTPPLITALGISGLYLGTAYCFVWTVHISGNPVPIFDLLLFILPVNILFISMRLIFAKSMEYEIGENRKSKVEKSGFLGALFAFRKEAVYLPVLGLVLVIPVLGIASVVLILFGQAPDAAIKAFTETSDFVLSKRVSPVNLTVDEHYLCTVAADGDEWLVKPIRSGVRHGHEVTVNRQLMIANAFEDVIMVRTPRFHRAIRHFYDTYGFPVARLIKKKWVADVVYLIMKPLEWIFLVFLYLVDVHPEDRISIQYTGETLKTFSGRRNIC